LPKFRAEGRRLLESGFPFVVVAPQCPPDRNWCDQDVLEGLHGLLEEMTANGQANAERLYATGFSMGGVGAFAWRAAGRPASPRSPLYAARASRRGG
jgi:predicted peptidase